MNIQKFLIGSVVAVLLICGLVFPRSNPVANQVAQSFGSVVGPDSSFPRETHNGVAVNYYKVGFQVASSTICTIKSPAVDTRLEHASIRYNSLPGYATNFMLGYGAQTATTTSIIAVAQMAYPASATNQTVSASSTASVIIPANSYINLNYSTSTGATITTANFPVSGSCAFELVEL